MIVINISLGLRRATELLFVLELLNILLIIILAQAISVCWHVAEIFWSSCGGPIFVGAPVRPNILNMPKSASVRRNFVEAFFYFFVEFTKTTTAKQFSFSIPHFP